MADSLQNDGKLILKSDDTPFETEKAAKIRCSTLKTHHNIKSKVVEVDGGYACLRLYAKTPKRVPLGRRNVLTFPEIPGYEIRVFNDDPKDMGQRIAAAEAAGWEIVYSEKQLGDNIAGQASSMGSKVSKPVGNGATGILMKKRKDWYEEDTQLKQDEITDKERELVAARAVEGKYGKIKVGKRPY